MAQIIGNGTVKLNKKISFLSYAAVVGKKEGEGPLGHEFDDVYTDAYLGLKSFEDAESKLMENAVLIATKKAGLKPQDAQYIFAGDLLNQCIASTFGVYNFGVPLIGMYGACSTMALTLANASIYLESGAAERVVCTVSSHFCTAERQYRFPLEYGAQRTPTAQWTVTGSGAAVLGDGDGPYISSLTFGRPVDFSVKDANNMGAAMAPQDVKIRPYP